MEPNGWLQALLEKMDNDIADLRADVKKLNEFRWRVAGQTIVVSGMITLIVNVLAIYLTR